MKKLFVALLISASCLASGWSQSAGTAPAAGENSLLWEISGKGMKQPSYLFGTIHMINKKDFFLTEPMLEAFEQSGQVTFEINLEDMNDLAVMMPLMMKAFMANDTTLRDLLDEEDYKIVSDHFEELGLPMMFLERIKPMFLSVLGSDTGLQMQQGSNEVVSYEMEFMDMARRQGKRMAGLETAEYQMSMFDSIPYRVQADMLVETIRSGSSGDDQFQQMVDLYKKQDLQGLAAMLASEEGGIGVYEDLLLVRRNRNWIPIMEKMMQEQRTFFAVGAGHLTGEQGVIALLREQGYTMKPLK